jgi:hypothetical protein
VRPPIPGIDSAGVYLCWTLEDARHIMALAIPARVCCRWRYFIAASSWKRWFCGRVTVVEMADRMCPA